MPLNSAIASDTEADYVGVYYLLMEDGVGGFGHAALLLVRENGSGTFYSFAASLQDAGQIILGMDVDGYLSKAEIGARDVDIFLGRAQPPKGGSSYSVPDAGKIQTDSIDSEEFLDGETTPYSKYIYIPVTAQEGAAMHDYAEQLRAENGTVKYNMYNRNCSMVAQDILEVAGKKFAVGSREGSAVDEQIALVAFLGSLFISPSLAVQIVISKIHSDYEDQTIPKGAYSAGCSMAKPDGDHPDWELGLIDGDCSKKLKRLNGLIHDFRLNKSIL